MRLAILTAMVTAAALLMPDDAEARGRGRGGGEGGSHSGDGASSGGGTYGGGGDGVAFGGGVVCEPSTPVPGCPPVTPDASPPSYEMPDAVPAITPAPPMEGLGVPPPRSRRGN